MTSRSRLRAIRCCRRAVRTKRLLLGRLRRWTRCRSTAWLTVDPNLEKTAMLDARIELHQRLALPLACVLLALAGVPLGITSRRAGKSSAVVLTLALAMFLLHWADQPDQARADGDASARHRAVDSQL